MKYPLFKVHVNKRDALKEIGNVLDSGFINEGAQVTALTEAMQRRFQTEQLILVNSCTSALTLALHLAGVRKFGEVITTSMTCVATNCPIMSAGADIIWADIDPSTGCVDPDSVEKILRENAGDPIIKALIVVAWAGNPPEMQRLRQLCDQYKIALILDAAHAFGATYQDDDISALADYTCYSFQAIKHITTGDGGMLICRDRKKWLLSKQLKWFGIDRDAAKDSNGNWKGQHWDFDIVDTGFKFNMNNIAAALGLSQLPHVDKILSGHRDNAKTYVELFQGCEYAVPIKAPENSQSAHWVYTVVLKPEHASIRDELLKELNAVGIGAGLVHVPNDAYTCFQTFQTDLPGVRTFFERQLSLPVGWWLNSKDIKKIFKAFNSSCKKLLK